MTRLLAWLRFPTRRRLAWLLPLVVLTLATFFAWLTNGVQGTRLLQEATHRTPHELVRYVLHRMDGHPWLEKALRPPLRMVQRQLEREPPDGLPTLGKGQQTLPLPLVRGITHEIVADTPQGIRDAILNADPGTRIIIAPGLYPFSETIRLGRAGRADLPIVVSASLPGSVLLEFAHREGILVDQPHWTFENLNIKGVCPDHDICEHALHVVGRGEHTTIRNNHISDFNAHLKVNGSQGDWPDHGLIEHNTLDNSAPRLTSQPVALLDLVGASDWTVRDNLVLNFANRGGNQVAYGLYMKGASEGGRFERNLVVCSPKNISAPGIRVGISFGGGNTGSAYCRDGSCANYEHQNGLAINNIVAHCNDTAFDVNHSRAIVLAYNTAINTSGFALRRAPSEALLYGNLYEGRTVARDGAELAANHNRKLPLFGSPGRSDRLDVDNLAPDDSIPLANFVTSDFFQQSRHPETQAGAVARHQP